MPERLRDYRAEYARRIARNLAQGKSHSQARGHAKATEPNIRVGAARPIPDDRMQLAFRVLRQEKSLSKAAKAAKLAPERLRKYAAERGLIEKTGRRWKASPDLPRRMLIYSKGASIPITVGDFATASKVGRYMAAVRHFLDTNRREFLLPFDGESVRDIAGKDHPFETRPNVLYRLASAGEHTFEQIYRLVI